MGRRLNPITDGGPVGQFAKRLRARREAASEKLTYRSMADRSYCTHSVLAEAAAGKVLPTLSVTEEFVKACGADEAEVAEWVEYWEQTQLALRKLAREQGVVVHVGSATTKPKRSTRARPVRPDLAEPGEWLPAPGKVRTFDDLRIELNKLKIAVGSPSLGQLCSLSAKDTGHPHISTSTMSEIFTGRRAPGIDNLRLLVRVLLAYSPPADAEQAAAEAAWRSIDSWRSAWRTAEHNRLRPDLMRRRAYGGLVLVTHDQEGPTAALLAEMDPRVAAALLVSLSSKMSAQIMNDMPAKQAQEVLKAMVELTGETGGLRGDNPSSGPGGSSAVS
jgi:hypothetical protein